MAEVVIGCFSNMLSKIGEKLIVQTGRHLGYLIHYNKNIKSLEQQTGKLIFKSQGVTLEVDEARRNGDIVAPEVEHWFTEVNAICDESKRFLEVEVAENKGFLHGWIPNIKKRYLLSKKAKKRAGEVTVLRNEGFLRISYPAPPLGVGERSIENFKNFDSRVPTVNDLMKFLNDETRQMISICGMGGAGKTTMVKEIARRVKGEKLFDEIVMSVVSKEHDLMKVQEDLAKWLGLKFKATNLEGRANELWKRLLQSKKGNLVILDDVWKRIDLREIGIPFGRDYKNCKVIFTSRSEDTCKAMGCEEILTIDVLTPSEAWSLFGETVGDSLRDPEVYQTASEIAKRCGGLPIAIACLGRALKDKRKEVWNDTLLKLQRSVVPTNIVGVKEEVYQSLQVSYDLLEDEEAQKLFLLCCMYPEYANIPLEALVRYGMGLEFFKGINLFIEARDRVHALTGKLRSRFLLLSGDRKSTVKVHNVVRAVGISVASKEEPRMGKFNAVVAHDEKWPRSMAYEHCNGISIVSNGIVELPPRGLHCPNLEVLQLACPNLSISALQAMFERMKKLRVLDIWNMSLPSLSSLLHPLPRELVVLCMDCKTSSIGDMPEEFGNLEVLSLGHCDVKELPREIGKVTNLKLLDMSGCHQLERISPGVITSLSRMEELDTGSKWWGDQEQEDASLKELESLTDLIYLGIQIKNLDSLPENPLFDKLQRYVISVGVDRGKSRSFSNRMLLLKLESTDTQLRGGIDKLLQKNTEKLFLTGDGLKTALKELAPGGFQSLKKLTVECCNSEGTEYLGDFSGTAQNGGVFPNLQKLHVEKMWHLKGLLFHHDEGFPASSFGNLRKIHLSVLPALTHLFTLPVATNLVHLESLHIEYCTNMEQVIFNPRPSASVNATGNRILFPKLTKLILNYVVTLICFSQGIDLQVEFPQLKILKLEYLLNFYTMCPEDTSSAILGNHAGSNLRALFDHKVEFLSLEELTISNVANIKEVWCGHIPNLVHLQGLYVQFCHMMEEIIFIQRPSVTTTEVRIVFLKLKEVILFGLNRLTVFCRGIDHVEFPQLRVLRLRWLTHFQSFCPEETTSQTSVFNDKVTFPSLETLEVSELDSIEELWSSQLPTSHFGKLKYLRVEKCHKLVNIFPSHLQTSFPSLENLEVDKCDLLKQVWGRKGVNNGNIKRITVSECPNLRNLCTSSTFKGLLNLQTLDISNCKMMEEVVSDEKEEEDRRMETLSLSKLEEVKLEFLPNLSYFSHTKYEMYLPALNQMVIKNCPEMRIFSGSSLSTPKLKSAEVDGVKTWFGDLNSTIEHFFH